MYKIVVFIAFSLLSTNLYSFAPFTLGKITKCLYYHQESKYDGDVLVSQGPKIFYSTKTLVIGSDCPFPPAPPDHPNHETEGYEFVKEENGISHYRGTTIGNEDCAIEAIKIDIIYD